MSKQNDFNRISRQNGHGAGDFQAPEPYPPIEVRGPNRYYARILQEDLAGQVSEMSAVSQYSYHHFVTDQPEATEVLEGISIVEMHHMEILAGVIRALGGDPRFQGFEGRYWSADLVYYGADDVDRITSDIAAEKQAIQQYRYHQSLIADPKIQTILERIIQDELYHIVLFQKVLNEILK